MALHAHLRATQTTEEQDGRMVVLKRFTLTGETPRVVDQRVVVVAEVLANRPWLFFRADVCNIEWMGTDEALAHSATLGAGALVTYGDTLALRSGVPLSGLSYADADLIVELLAHEAVRIRHAREASVTVTGFLEMYAE